MNAEIEEENKILRERLNRVYRALSDPLIIMGEHGLRPVKGTTRQDVYKACLKAQRFQREWLRPAIVSKKFGEVWHKERDV